MLLITKFNLIDFLINITKNANNLLIYNKKNNLKTKKSNEKKTIIIRKNLQIHKIYFSLYLNII